MTSQEAKALVLLHKLLVQARVLALTNPDIKKIVILLDIAEWLPMEMIDRENWEDSLRSRMRSLVRIYPEFEAIAKQYDANFTLD